MNVLVACECSQIVTSAFREQGNFAISCDLVSSYGGHPEWHYKGDCFDLIDAVPGTPFKTEDGNRHFVPAWDLLIAHPPCTYLSAAGSLYWNDPDRQKKRSEAAHFFFRLCSSHIPHRCIENPRGWINHLLPPSQEIHPYYFGDRLEKRTDLWLFNLPYLYATCFVERPAHVQVGRKMVNPLFANTRGLAPERRRKIRSEFFPGVAKAMSIQWSEEVLKGVWYGNQVSI